MIRNTPQRLPLYAQIKLELIRRIGDGEWPQTQALPSEWDLAAQLDVSQGTVRKALGELVAQGVLTRYQGRGTFVAEVVGDWGVGCLVTPGLFHEPRQVRRWIRIVRRGRSLSENGEEYADRSQSPAIARIGF